MMEFLSFFKLGFIWCNKAGRSDQSPYRLERNLLSHFIVNFLHGDLLTAIRYCS